MGTLGRTRGRQLVKIMHILKHCHEGNGHVHVAVDLACAQADAGHRVAFVSSGGRYEDLLASHNVRLVSTSESVGLLGLSRSAASLASAVRAFRPDIIHAHMMSSAVLGFLVAKNFGAPLITTMHNSFDGHSILMRLGDVVVAVSDAERNLLVSRGYPTTQVVTVLNGADGSPRESLAVGTAQVLAKPCVVTLSGLHERKAVNDTILAFADVLPDFPHWHLNIIGSGPDRQLLENMVIDLDLTRSIHFLGSFVAPRLLLEQASIFASSSLAEPFGLSIAEARAAGCAIVATDVGGVPEVLDHGTAGILTPASDPASMASAFRVLMGDEVELDALAAQGQARLRALYCPAHG